MVWVELRHAGICPTFVEGGDACEARESEDEEHRVGRCGVILIRFPFFWVRFSSSFRCEEFRVRFGVSFRFGDSIWCFGFEFRCGAFFDVEILLASVDVIS